MNSKQNSKPETHNTIMSDLINQWKGQKRAKHKYQFLKNSAKQKKKLKKLAHDLDREVFSELDCLDCANCCTSIPPIVSRVDASRIAKTLGMKTKVFIEEYLVQDDDGDWVMNTSPCPFLLQDHKCSIYEDRPKACREFPHTDGESFIANLNLHVQNVQYCPAVFHILERMEKMI